NGAGMQASTYFAGVGRYGVNNHATLLGLALTVPGCLLLVPRLGIIGAALSMTLAYTAGTLYLFAHYRHAIGATWADLLPGWDDVRWLMTQLARPRQGQ
ncbi:MAG: polysaccharide biosynthesis C-terminal domain-containing protein, partial [Bacteroidota bacterium]|nr:polysaccharide biosynthesis C-terminal domain-containing protein [Bacteroidota bacterium]